MYIYVYLCTYWYILTKRIVKRFWSTILYFWRTCFQQPKMVLRIGGNAIPISGITLPFLLHADTTWYVVNCDWVLFFNWLIIALSYAAVSTVCLHSCPIFPIFTFWIFSYVAMYYSTFNVYNLTLQY